MNMMKIAQFIFRKIISAYFIYIRKNSSSFNLYSGIFVPEYENLFKNFLNENLRNVFSLRDICSCKESELIDKKVGQTWEKKVDLEAKIRELVLLLKSLKDLRGPLLL